MRSIAICFRILLPLVAAALPGCSDLGIALRETFGREVVPERISVPPPQDGSYPNLASVPNERPQISSPAAREVARARLERARAAARTFDQPLPRTGIAAPAVRAAEGGELLPPPPFVGQEAALAPPPPLPPGPPGELVAVIYFGPGSARLTAADRLVLRDALELQRRLGGDLIAVGHDSPTAGSPEAAFALSVERAAAVARAFGELGAPQDKLRLEAQGDRQPVYSEEAATGIAANRRVEVYLAP